MALLLLLSRPAGTPAAPVADTPAATSTAWFPRPYLALDTTGYLPLAQVLARAGVDARLLYEVADANGITDLRNVKPGMLITLPR